MGFLCIESDCLIFFVQISEVLKCVKHVKGCPKGIQKVFIWSLFFSLRRILYRRNLVKIDIPDGKAHVAHTGPTCVLSIPGGPHVGPVNFTIKDVFANSMKIAFRITGRLRCEIIGFTPWRASYIWRFSFIFSFLLDWKVGWTDSRVCRCFWLHCNETELSCIEIKIISSHTLLGMWSLIHVGINVIPCL